MNAKLEHSPLPWRLDDGFECEILDRYGTHLFTCTSQYSHLGDETDAANAALIVEAVNGHEELLRVRNIEVPYWKARIARLEIEKRELENLVLRMVPAVTQAANWETLHGSPDEKAEWDALEEEALAVLGGKEAEDGQE